MANGQIKVLLPFVVVAVVVVVWPMNDWTVKWVERCVVDPNLSCQVQVKSLLINGPRSLSVCHMHTRGHFLTIPNHHGLQYAASAQPPPLTLALYSTWDFAVNLEEMFLQQITEEYRNSASSSSSSASSSCPASSGALLGNCRCEMLSSRWCGLTHSAGHYTMSKKTYQPATDLIPVHTRPDTGARGWEKPPIYF